jgi:hypothetical protein
MTRFGVVAFQLGRATSEPVTGELLDFYAWVAERVSAQPAKLAAQEIPTTVGIDTLTLHKTPEAVYGLFTERAKAWDDAIDVAIVHVQNPPQGIVRGGFSIHLAAALQASLEGRARPKQVILMMSPFPPEGDAIRRIIEELRAMGRLVIISDNGQILQASVPTLDETFGKEYALRLARVRSDSSQLLGLKMIRRMGHFKRLNGEQSECLRYYFDGSLCDAEISDLFSRYLAEAYPDQKPPVVLWHCPQSPWLTNGVLAACVDHDIPCMDFDEFLRLEVTEIAESAAPILLIVPMVLTGRTVRQKIREILNRYPSMRPSVVTILTTIGDAPKGKRRLKVNDEFYDIRYFLKVAGAPIPSGECTLCRLGVPESKPWSRDEYVKLTSYEMWELVRQAGWKPEDDPPGHRASLTQVPRFPEIIYDNAAWLASKLKLLLEFVLDEFPAAPVVVCPAHEKGADALTQCLQAILNVTVIKIPRSVIDCFDSPEPNLPLSEWEQRRPQWYIQLSTLVTSEVIVMDEFNVSGRTRAGLKAIVELFGKSVTGYFAVQDFNPSEISDLGIANAALYDFEINSPTV